MFDLNFFSVNISNSNILDVNFSNINLFNINIFDFNIFDVIIFDVIIFDVIIFDVNIFDVTTPITIFLPCHAGIARNVEESFLSYLSFHFLLADKFEMLVGWHRKCCFFISSKHFLLSATITVLFNNQNL